MELKLQDPALFPKDIGLSELIIPSRPLTDRYIHSAVLYISNAFFGGDLIIGNIVLFWVYHVLFIAGCYFLGRRVLRSAWGGTLFALASVVPSRALFDWWGMGYGGGVIPHVLIFTAVPWFVLGFLETASQPRRLIILFSLLGLSANLYALAAVSLFAVLFVTALTRRPTRWLLAGAMAFLLGAAPALYLAIKLIPVRFADLSPAARELTDFLLVRHYGYATFQPWMVTLKGILKSPVWLFLAIGAVGLRLKHRHHQLFEDDRWLAWIAVVTLALVFGWMVAARFVIDLIPLLFYRASTLLYIPAYLGCLWLALYFLRHRKPMSTLSGLILLGAVLFGGVPRTTLYSTIMGHATVQTSSDFYELCDWAQTTPPHSLFVINPNGYHFFAFRVYARRAITMHRVLGETAISVPANAHLYWEMVNDIQEAYESRSREAFLQVARKYQADYIIDLRSASPLDLAVAFQNGTFTVYAVPPEEHNRYAQ
ncbi:MAG: hypothetical protein N2508_07085 [Anaerolineae bacterium]|nr:hypothetical protein [Anaerolineae bacterium]